MVRQQQKQTMYIVHDGYAGLLQMFLGIGKGVKDKV